MNFRNFVLRLAHRHGTEYTVAVIESPFGRASGDFQIPEAFGDAVTSPGRNHRGATRDLSPYEDFAEPTPAQEPALTDEAAGKALFEAVFQGKVGELFLKSHDPNIALRLRLLLGDGPDLDATLRLHALPWEWLTTSAPLALDAHFSVVRELEGDALLIPSHSQTRSHHKLRILLVGSNPNDTQRLDLATEQKLLERMESQAAIDFVPLTDISRRGLYQKLEEGFHGVHFMGHGDWLDGIPVLFFRDEHGDADPVSGTQLVEDLRGLPRACWPKLFVLNACHGGASALGPRGLTGIAAALNRAGMPAVVAMRREIGDDAAILFSEVFYRALTQGGTLDEAMVKARLAIKREARREQDWATPCLYSKLEDGFLHAPKPAQVQSKTVTGEGSRRSSPLPQALKWTVLPLLLLLTMTLWKFFTAADGPVRLAIDPMTPSALAQVPTGLDPVSLKVAWSRIEGLAIVDDRPDFRMQLQVDRQQTPNLFTAMIFNRDHEAVGEVPLHLPQETHTAETHELVSTLTARMLPLIGLGNSGGQQADLPRVPVQALLENNRAVALAAAGDLKEAEAVFRTAARNDPGYAAPQAGLTAILIGQARYRDALAFAKTAASLAPQVALFHYHLGLCLTELGDQNEANAAFDQALALDPFLVDALHERAKSFLADGDLRRSQRLLDRARQVDPTRAVLYKTYGRWHLANQQPNDALLALDQAIGLTSDPNDPILAESLYLKTEAQLALGQIQPASQTMASFENLPNAKLLPWFSKIQALAAKHALQTTPRTRAKNPAQNTTSHTAMFTSLEGEIWVAPGSANPWQPTKLSSVSGQSVIRLAKDARATMVCGSGNTFELRGPGDWRLDEVCSHHTQEDEPALPILMTARQTSALGSLLIVASRSGQDGLHAILGPIGATLDPSPDLTWTEVPGAIAYEITIETAYSAVPHMVQADRCQRQSIQLGPERQWHLTWPWPGEPLPPGSSFTVRIWPEFSADDPQFVDEFRGKIKVLEDEMRDRVAALEIQIDALPIGEAERLEIRAQIYGAHGLWGMANQLRLAALAKHAGTDNLLSVAETWLRADLDSLAANAFQLALDEGRQLLQKARAERGLGLLALRDRKYEIAIAHLGLARANFLRESRADLVAQINIAIDEAWKAYEATGKSRRLERE